MLDSSNLNESEDDKLDIDLRTTYERKPPGLKSLPKCWWVKEIAAGIYVSGRCTSRIIKYASESGYCSFVSLYKDDKPSTFGGSDVPGTDQIEQICKLTELQFDALITRDEEWASEETVSKFASSLTKVKRPVILLADSVTKAAYIALLYLLKNTTDDETFEPKFDPEDVYRMCAALGMVPIPKEVKGLIDNISGTETEDKYTNIGTDSTVWTRYWLVQHISKTWYTAGQIRKGELDIIRSAGFKTIVNLRLGMTHEGKPSQEPVTLLNLPDSVKTLSEDMKPYRQVPDVAKGHRIRPEIDPAYVSSDCEVNFETRNTEEFGDDLGFNEEVERAFFEQTDLPYHHFPLVSGGNYFKYMFDEMKGPLLEAASRGPVLLHCRSGRRVAYFGALLVAVQEGRSLEWALKRVAELGFPIGPDLHPYTYKMYCEVLNG